VILPYGIKLVKGDRPIRSISLEGMKFEAKDDGSPAHVRNFLDCLKSRQRPTTDIEIAHHSTNTTHLGNIAFKTRRTLTWDAEAERFVNDIDANMLLGRDYRRGYELPEI
jgi:hypothetical protein